MELNERRRLLQNWRGRRFLACRASDDLRSVCMALGDGDGSELPPTDTNPLPEVSPALKAELENAVVTVLRLIMIANEGNVSPSRLNAF